MPPTCVYCGKTRPDLIQVRIWRNGEIVWVWTCPDKAKPTQILPDCANNAQASAEG